MSLLLFFGVILLIGHLSCAEAADSPYQCDENGLRRFDANVARLVTIGNSGRKFPENKDKELKVFCNETFDLISQLEKYKTYCLINMPKQVSSVLIYALKNVLVKQICKRDSKLLSQAIAATPCINQANGEITKCYTKFIDSVLGAKNAVETKRIPHLCCEYYKLFPCFHERTTRFNKCSTKHIDVAADIVGGIVDNVISLICTDYTQGSDKCSKLEPPPKKLKTQKRTRSFMVPVIDLLDSFQQV